MHCPDPSGECSKSVVGPDLNMHVSRCIIRDAELIAFEWGWTRRSIDAFGFEGQNRTQNVERHESHSRAAPSLGLHSDKHILLN